MEKLRLKGIYIYPIKSIPGVSLHESFAGERGLKYDRRWMLIDENDRFITQRQCHEMALIDLRLEGGLMVMNRRLKSADEIKIPLEIHEGEQIRSQLFKDEVGVIWPKLMADAWFSKALNTKCRLVYMPENSRRQIDPDVVPVPMNTSLSDGYPYLLTNQTSLKDVSKKAGIDFEMKRFRPNLVVETDEAFEEDSWRSVKIGEVIFRIVKPCARCVLTTIDPETGDAGKEPLKTLATYRKQYGKILFGQNMIAETGGLIRIDDEIKLMQ